MVLTDEITNNAYDSEWILLMMEAKKIGLSPSDVGGFLRANSTRQGSENVCPKMSPKTVVSFK